MRLDRNVNPDGRGKYAIINLRTSRVEWGGPDAQFFVIKYKDKFAAAALKAYAEAVLKEAMELGTKAHAKFTALSGEGKMHMALEESQKIRNQAASLQEYAQEMLREAEAAAKYATRIPD